MTDLFHHAGSVGTTNSMVDLFATGINPAEFQVDPQYDYVDLSRSYFELELTLKKNGANNVAAADNLAHSSFKQISVRLNGTLNSRQTDMYHYKAYLETLLNYDREDGETVLKPQGWYNSIDLPAILTPNNVDTAANAGAGHNDFQQLSTNQQANVKLMKEQAIYTEGKTHVLRFRPHIEVFHLNKLLVPSVQIGIHMYFNQPDLFLNGVALHGRLTAPDVKVKLYLCQVRINPSVYRELMETMDSGKVVSYATVRSEIRTFNMQGDQQHFECSNPLQNRIPNLVIVALVASTAFNGTVTQDPFAFQKFGLSSIKQLVRGEEYPYETLKMAHDNSSKDLRGYFRFLQATGSLGRHKGNMVTRTDWGAGKNCTLFIFDNAANGCLNSPVLNPKQSGELRLVFNFGANP